MVDVDTFLTLLYVMVDDFCQSQQHEEMDFLCYTAYTLGKSISAFH